MWLLSIPCSWARMLLPTPVPKSFFEILKEMQHGTHITISAHPDLKAWLHGGVSIRGTGTVSLQLDIQGWGRAWVVDVDGLFHLCVEVFSW